MTRPASLSSLLQFITGTMAAILVIVFAFSAVEAWKGWGAALEAKAIARISRDLFTALASIRVERGTVNTALSTPDLPAAETLSDIAALRAKSDPALKSAFAGLDKLQLADLASAVAEVRRNRDAVARLRSDADQALAVPKANRPPDLGKSWVPAVGAFADSIDVLSDRLSVRITRSDPFIAEQMTIKQLAWATRAAAGTDRLLVGAAIAGGNGLPQDQQRQLAELAGQMESTWKLIGTKLQQPGMPAKLKEAYDRGQQAYFNALGEERKAIVADLVGNQTPSVSGAEWVRDSNPGLERLVDVAFATFDVIEGYAQNQADAAMLKFAGTAGLTLAFAVLGLGAATFVARRIARPMAAIAFEMQLVARGDLKRTILFQNRRDEIGDLARALAVFRDTSTKKLRIEQTQREEQERREHRQRTIEQQITTFDGSIRGLLDALSHAATEMRSTSETMSATAEETDRQATAVTSAATQASANVETVASASEELSMSVGEIGRQVSHAADIANKAVNETRSTDSTVKGLSDAAQRIGEVVELINDIAAQTNLLALNATIEAARAGDAGRGFAVVASEVKSLATQTAMATDDIAAQIAAIQDATRGAVDAIKRVGGIISEVSEISTAIASAIEEQSAATKEITRNTQEAARGTMSVSANIEGVSQGAGMTGRASEQVLQAAGELARTSERLRTEVDAFLGRMRAA